MSVSKEPHEMALGLLKITRGHLRPSQLLDLMKSSIPIGEEENFLIRELFIQKLPPNIHSELHALKNHNLMQLAEAAEKLLPSTNIMNLPPEILGIIFNNLYTTKDIINCKKVCIFWKNVVEANFKGKYLLISAYHEIVDLLNPRTKFELLTKTVPIVLNATGGLIQKSPIVCDGAQGCFVIGQPKKELKIIEKRWHAASVALNQSTLWIVGGICGTLGNSSPVRSSEFTLVQT